ncbi:MAG: alkaline phosphatase family protein [Alphaproteobacteria bacterium]|nr:alkaline phosphatase family protein [Alphaproteobacteria bacterium]
MPDGPFFDHIVIIGLDGLRPDVVSPSLTPNLQAVVDMGCYLSNHRAVFPSETRVNLASLSTGGRTAEHGVVANYFLCPEDGFAEVQNTATAQCLGTLTARYSKRPFEVDWLGSILARHGHTFAVLATGSVGSTSFLGWDADRLGQFVFNPFQLSLSTPAELTAEIVARYGELGSEDAPRTRSIRYLTDAFLDYVWRRRKPTVSIIWFAEPDKSQHVLGPGSEGANEAIRALDGSVGRLLAWREEQENPERIGFIVLSDHGHVSVLGAVSVATALRDGGFRVGDGLADGDDIALALRSNTLGLWARGGDAALLADASALLSEQEWSGIAFSHGEPGEIYGIVPGTFSHGSVFADHPLAPPLRFTLGGDNGENRNGLPGRCYFAGKKAVGVGTHGGLHIKEMTAFGALYGGSFRPGARLAAHSSISDILPTILHCLGIEESRRFGGRVLLEAFNDTGAGSGSQQGRSRMETLSLTSGGKQRNLLRANVSSYGYVDHAWVGNKKPAL